MENVGVVNIRHGVGYAGDIIAFNFGMKALPMKRAVYMIYGVSLSIREDIINQVQSARKCLIIKFQWAGQYRSNSWQALMVPISS